MKSLLSYFNERSFLVNLLAGAICLLGLFSLINLKRDLVPAFKFNIINVESTLIGANAEQIEKLLTIPIQDTLASLPGIKRMNSESLKNSSQINIFFEAGINIEDSINEINSRLSALKSQLPTDIEDFEVYQQKNNDIELMGYAVKEFDNKNIKHRDWLKTFEADLKQIKGIAKVNTSLPKIQIKIILNSEKLEYYGITSTEVRDVISQHLSFYPVANLISDGNTYNIEVNTTPQNINDISNIPLKANRFTNTIYLKNVAETEIAEISSTTKNIINNKELLTFYINKDINSDAINMSEKVSLFIADKTNNPYQFEFMELYDTSNLISKQLTLLTSNGSMGFLLVAILLTLVIGFRFSIITLLGLPVSYLGTLIFLNYFNISFDLISFVAMILIVGILVDDAIIVAERYAELLKEGMEPKQASLEAAYSMLIPVTGTVLTTVIAFAPILFIKSEVSEVMYSIPVVIISALFISWIECFFILPNHLQHFVQKVNHKKVAVFDKLASGYEFLLVHILKLRYLTILAITGLFTTAGFVVPKLKKNFNLNINIPSVRVNYELAHAKSLEDALDQIEDIYKYLENTVGGDTTYIQTRLGVSWHDGKLFRGNQHGYFRLYIEQTHERPEEQSLLIQNKIKQKIEEWKQLPRFKYLQIMEQQGDSDQNQDDENRIELHVDGDDTATVHKITEVIKNSLKTSKILTKVIEDDHESEYLWSFQSKPEMLKLYGLSNFELTQQIKGQVDEVKLREIRIEGESLDVVTQLDHVTKNQFDSKKLTNLKILTANKILVPLSFLGEWTQKTVPQKIRHLNSRRTLVFPIEFDGKSINKDQAVEELEKMIPLMKEQLPSYKLLTKKISDEDEEVKKWGIQIFATCIICILLVLAIILNNLSQPLIVGMAIPFGIIGVIFALYAHQMPISLMAVIGLIGVAGVAVNDSLIMVDSINRLKLKESNETSFRQLIVKGARSRFRPIFLTSITTLGGVFPMAYGWFGESGFTQPLAFAMGWGLLSATILTLIGIPTLYLIRDDVGVLSNKIYRILKKR